jgi:predicted RND superfamily exporter protein
VLPLATIGIGLLWLLGLMAFFNAHFTLLALMLPTLMLAIGCSYMIHVLNQVGIAAWVADVNSRSTSLTPGQSGQFHQSATRNPRSDCLAAIEQAMRFINLPVMVSALTIIAGFLSLAFSEVPAIRSTAVYAAIGAAFTMILSLTFIPAVLAILPSQVTKFRSGQSDLPTGMVKLLVETGRWATSHQTLLYILTAVIVIASVIGVFRIRIEIDFFKFLKPHSEERIGLAEINRRLSGPVPFEMVVEGQQAGAIEKPDVLGRIADLQTFAEGLKIPTGERIDRALSVADFIKHLNRAFHGGDPQQYVIPPDEEVIADLLSDRDQLKGFLTEDGRAARILLRSNLTGSQAMAAAVRDIERRGRELLPEFRVYATGTFVLLNRTSDQIAGEQEQSIAIALVTIFLMLAALFRSLRVGITALVPNLVPVLFFFGFMGWRGIPLNLTTSLVASVVLGLAVDNAVQFIVRFRRVQREGLSLRDAIIESMRLSGRPIIYANVALAATFAIFAVSNFEPIASFGLLSAVTILGCLIEDLVLLPSRLTSPVFRSK